MAAPRQLRGPHRLALPVVVLATALGVGACAAGAGTAASAPDGSLSGREGSAATALPSPASRAAGSFGAAGTPDSDAGAAGGSAVSPATLATDALSGRSVIRTASTTLRVREVLAASARVNVLAAGDGGYVADEQTDARPDHPDQGVAVLTVRVPANRLTHLLGQLESLGTLVSEQQASDDVTAKVVDLQARLTTQRASVQRVRALLAQATTLGDVVRVEGELASREATLESLEAQSKQLADQTALATVTATLLGPAKAKPVAAAAEEPASGFGAGLHRGWHAFVTATNWLLTGLGAVLPFLLLLAGVAAVLAAVIRRRRPAAPEPPAASAA